MQQPDEIIARMQAGDQLALSELYFRYSKALAGVIQTIVRDKESAEEVLQDVFIRTWNSRNSYDPKRGRFYTWLLNIARNASIDHTRSKAFKNSKQNLNPGTFVDNIKHSAELTSQTDGIGLRKIVDQLPETCVGIIDLIYFKGYTQMETSEALSMPLGTVKTRLRGCIQKLRKALGIEL